MNRKLALIIGISLLSLVVFWGCAKHEHPEGHEHPAEKAPAKEHPAGEKKETEHPDKEAKGEEHPTKKAPAKAVTKEELAEAIEEYVTKDAELKGGYFLVYDQEAGETLALKLDLVHKARLSRISADVYFACADFKTPKGKTYDLDVFMKGTTKNNLKVTEVAVHKEEGKARYTWHEEGGIWKKKYKEAKKTAPKKVEEHKSEHPEHPK